MRLANFRSILILVIIFICNPSHSFSDKYVSFDEVSKAQVNTMMEINSELEYYARSIGIDSNLITYCKYKMELDTYQYPLNGYSYLGTNLREIKTEQELLIYLWGYKSFDLNYLKLCLANAKNTLSQAEK